MTTFTYYLFFRLDKPLTYLQALACARYADVSGGGFTDERAFFDSFNLALRRYYSNPGQTDERRVPVRVGSDRRVWTWDRRWTEIPAPTSFHECDGCGRLRRDVRSVGRDANGDPEAPGLCFFCRKNAERGFDHRAEEEAAKAEWLRDSYEGR